VPGIRVLQRCGKKRRGLPGQALRFRFHGTDGHASTVSPQRIAMSLGLLVIILIIFLLGVFGGRRRLMAMAWAAPEMRPGGLILVVLIIPLLLGKL
jgi:hypothetical protein